MSDVDLTQLRALFDEVCDLPPQQRGRVLDGRGLSPNVRRELDKLLASHDSVGEFMEKPAGQMPVDLQEDFGRVMSERDAKGSRLGGASREHDPLIGFSLGGYRISRVLGEGGMGVVYEAQQDQPSRTVALKVMRWSLPSERLRKRFQHEAQALGRLQHPGIAQIFEAGSAPGPDGRSLPFFAMEFVAGTPLLEYAKVQSFDARAKTELMAMVAEAVQHAHQKGVIHRDLKPANILVENEVTRSGTKLSGASATHGGARPRVLDFGIARLTEPQNEATAGTGESGIANAAAPSLMTDTGQLLGTVAYMSPEQARGDASAIDTRSDVYAMGVVLYELLTGQLPYDVRNKPITQAAAVIAGAEAKFDRERDSAIASELQTIVLKALEKEPERRYPSAGDLAADLRRHLEDLPISARPPTTLYHVRKFAKRNRALVAGIAAAFLMLVLGVVGTSIGLVRAKEAQKLAELRLTEAKLAAKTAENSEQFLISMLTAANPLVSKNRELTVRELIDEAALKIDSQLMEEPAVALRTRLALSKTYLSIAAFDQAQKQCDAAAKLAIGHFGEQSVEHSLVLAQQCEYFSSRNLITEGLPVAQRCLDMRVALLPADDVLVARAEYMLGRMMSAAAKFTDGLPHMRRAMELMQSREGTEAITYASDLASMLYRMRGPSQDEAIALLDATLPKARALGPKGNAVTASVLLNFASINSTQGNTQVAKEQTLEAIRLRETVYPPDHPNLLFAKKSLIRALVVNNEPAEAKRIADEALGPIQRVMGKDAPMLGDVYRERANACMAIPDLDCALASALDGVSLINEKTPFVYQSTSLSILAQVYMARKEWDKAIETSQRILAMAKAKGLPAQMMHPISQYLVRSLIGAGRHPEALVAVDESLSVLSVTEDTIGARMEASALKAEILDSLNRYDEALVILKDVIEQVVPLDAEWGADLLEQLAGMCEKHGDAAGAASTRERAARIKRGTPSDSVQKQ